MIKIKDFSIIKSFIQFLKKLKPNFFYGFSFYDILRMYIIGIVKGTLSSRAGSISFSFFMALFPFILFILNLIPFIDLIPFFSIQNFDQTLFTYIEFFIPSETQVFFNSIFEDIQNKPRGGLLSSVFILSIIFTANGVSAIFAGFEDSYHIELSRNLAERFNQRYSPTFTVPDPYIAKSSGRIMSLQNPDNKMSKSDENENNFIALLDDEDTIIRKVKRAVTDSGSEIIFSDDKPGLKNLITLYSCYSGLPPKDIENKYVGKMYSDFKQDLGELIAESLKPIRARYEEIISEKDYLSKVLSEGAEKATHLARRTLSKVYRKIGLVEK